MPRLCSFTIRVLETMAADNVLLLNACFVFFLISAAVIYVQYVQWYWSRWLFAIDMWSHIRVEVWSVS